jgi:ABC-2 type transport system permease protein
VGYAALVVVPFLAIPAAIGSAITLLLVRVFPARRTRDLLGVMAAAGVALLVLGLRMLRPERLVNPEGFRNLMDFLAVLRGPSSPWLPSEWASDALMGFLRGRADPFLLVLLWSTAAGATALGAVLHARHFSICYTRAQEGATRRVRWGGIWSALARWLEPLGVQRREMILKDARVFFRDATQWSQLIILGVLVVVYVYNMRVLPLRSSQDIGRFLSSLVTFLNVALTGFVLAAVAARFVFPSLSLEGRTLWLLRSSPLPGGSLLWSKYWAGLVPLLVLALALTLLTTSGLGVGRRVTLLSVVTITGLTGTFTAQALAWGIAYPKFESENAAQIPTSLGGLLFMLGALLTLGVVVAFQLWAMRGWVRSGMPWRRARPPTAVELALAAGFTVAVCAVSGVVAYREARRRLERLEV